MRFAAALAAGAFALASGFAAAALASVAMEDLTWPELRDAIAAGKTTVVVPIGGTEQNGPHMALGKHNVRAVELSTRIAEKLGNALVAPVIAYVPEGQVEPPTGHMKYPGTITIPEDVFAKTLRSVAASLRHAGFRDIVFLGDHGGYAAIVTRVAASLTREWKASGVRVLAPPEYYRELPHAGRDDTALTLGIRDGALVRRDHVDAKALQLGAAQDPSSATAEAGVALAQQIVDRTVESLKKGTARR